MKNFLLILFLFIIATKVFSQSFLTSLSYNYLYDKQLDKAIQTYNFNRPFLNKKQPLFVHGFGTEVLFFFKSDKPIKQGINATYSYFGSEATNENYLNRFNLHLINLNYLIRLTNDEKFGNMFGEIYIGATSSGLNRKWNGESFLVNDKRSKALGIGGNLGLRIGYHLYRKDKHHISPFVFFGYAPYLYAPNNEAVINATQELITESWTYVFNLKIGIAYQFNNQKQNDRDE